MTFRHATAAVACALAVLGTRCASITSDAGAPIAVEFVLPHFTQAVRVEEFDTVPLGVRVLNRAGDSIPGAPVQVVSLSPDTLAVDTLPLRLIGVRPGPARLLAISGSLHSDPLVVTVVRAPDSLARTSSDTFTVATKDSASKPLVVDLLDLRTDTTHQAIGLSGYPVVFTIVYPASPAAATVGFGNDTLAALVDTVTTSSGAASVIVKRHGPPPQPDSVVVQASATRANGTVVRGSPVLFIVRFQ